MTVVNLSDLFISNIKNNDYRVYISNIDKKEARIIFKKSNLDDKGVLYIEFKTLSFKQNITPVDVIKNQRFIQRFKKVHLVETYFRDIYSNRQINRWKRIVNKFVGVLKSKIKDLKSEI